MRSASRTWRACRIPTSSTWLPWLRAYAKTCCRCEHDRQKSTHPGELSLPPDVIFIHPFYAQPIPKRTGNHDGQPAPVFEVIRQGDAKNSENKTAPEKNQRPF